MHPEKNALKDLIDKLQEALVLAQKTNDSLLLYLIERALSHARDMIDTKVPPSKSGIKQPESVAFGRNQVVVANRVNRANLLAETERRLP
jgi:hypothetical protein